MAKNKTAEMSREQASTEIVFHGADFWAKAVWNLALEKARQIALDIGRDEGTVCDCAQGISDEIQKMMI